MEDRVGQVWASKQFDDADLSKATFFVITERAADWTNPHTKKVLAYWEGFVICDLMETSGRRYIWEEDSFRTCSDSWDNEYVRIA